MMRPRGPLSSDVPMNRSGTVTQATATKSQWIEVEISGWQGTARTTSSSKLNTALSNSPDSHSAGVTIFSSSSKVFS